MMLKSFSSLPGCLTVAFDVFTRVAALMMHICSYMQAQLLPDQALGMVVIK